MERSQLPPHKSATYVLPRWKVVYVAVNKAACTSLKWLIADIQGEDPHRFHRSISREVSRTMTIHRRSKWQRTPMLHRLSEERLARISPENGWFVFTVVRHPTNRFFSAWQSKLLLREGFWVERFGDEPWFPRIPSTTAEIVEDFQRFALASAGEPRPAIIQNRHFRPQGEMTTPDRTPYSRVYDVREMPVLLEDLDRHLRERGWEGDLSLPASNETPLRPLASMFTPEVTEAMAKIYRDDFEQFGYASPEPERADPAEEYTSEALDSVFRLIERSERIADLALMARAGRRQNRQLAHERSRGPEKPSRRRRTLARRIASRIPPEGLRRRARALALRVPKLREAIR